MEEEPSRKCKYPNCHLDARLADYEYMLWHPDEPRAKWIYCDVHDTETQRRIKGKGPEKPCEVCVELKRAVPGEAKYECQFCSADICAGHRYNATPSAKGSDIFVCMNCQNRYASIKDHFWVMVREKKHGPTEFAVEYYADVEHLPSQLISPKIW